MKPNLIYICVTFLALSAMKCKENIQPTLDVQGHRGWKGSFPENTLVGFREALKLGVNTLEMDVVISKDSQVVVSHEPWFNSFFTTLADGTPLSPDAEKNHNIFQLTYDEVKSYDVGLRSHPKYPQQQSVAAYKPTLLEVVTTMENEFKTKNFKYNIEIKRKKTDDGVFNPGVETFADLVIEVLEPLKLHDRVIIQSFDHETLIYIKSKYPKYVTAILVEDENGLESHLSQLRYIPEIYSPYYKNVDERLIHLCRAKNMKIIPWTINETQDIEQMINLGVDGIISDYPERVMELIKIKK